MKQIFALGITFLFVATVVTPMVVGFDLESKNEVVFEESSGPMDSPWPIKCHDNRHTGRSPYSASHVDCIEKWRFICGHIEDGIVIGDDATIYFGDGKGYLNALNTDGSLKWKYETGMIITAAPAIADDGTIYIPSWDEYLYAFNPDGSIKWRYYAGYLSSLTSSPIIAEDGTIYFGNMGPGSDVGRLHAVYSNGTEKWYYDTGNSITSDPAIGDDGTIYIGSMDSYFYALYPNGTLRWRFETGHYIQGPASIAEDGTIYISSWDDYLYALYPNGTMKWKCEIGVGSKINPSIAIDGTIYIGADKLYAIFPNGTIKWTLELGLGHHITDSSPAISADGTIYVGTHINSTNGGDIIAINPDGTGKWRKKIAIAGWVDSSPSIGEDGTVYVGSSCEAGKGYLHAFGSVPSNDPPNKPTIAGTINGKAGKEYSYRFTSIDPNNNPVRFYIEWGDVTSTFTGDYASGEQVWIDHTYQERGSYTIRVNAIDTSDEESDWAELTVSMPRYKTNSLLYWFQEEHPNLFSLLRQILKL